MNIWGRDLLPRQVACCLAFCVAAQLSYAAPAPAVWFAQQSPQSAQLAENAHSGYPLPDAPAPQQQQAPAPQNPQDNSQKPVGTAVAPVTHPAGIAGSSPSGAAIAPAKQRRVRRIMIRVGILVGAGVAVGTVVALSHGSPGRP